MGVRVNFDGVEPSADPGSGPLPEGEYVVLVDEAEQRTSQNGTPGIKVKLKVLVGEYEGRFLWDDIWVTQAALPYALHRLHCLGAPVPQGEFSLEPQHLTGRRAKVTVKHREYQGKQQVRVVGWDPAPGQASQAPAPSGSDPDIPF